MSEIFHLSTRARLTRLLFALVFTAALTGCGGDSPSSTQLVDPVLLSARERTEASGQTGLPLAITIGALTPDLTSIAKGSQAEVSAHIVRAIVSSQVAASASIPVDRSVSCPAGGTARTAGALTGSLAQGLSSSLAAAVTLTLTDCGVTVDSRTLLISSDPTLAATGSYVVVNRVPADQQTLRMTGNVRLALSGSRAPALPCALDLAVTTVRSTRTATMTGTFCGAPVTKDVTWTP